MLLRLLFGRAGSGKSTEVLRQIRQRLAEGALVTLIVPEQFTFETERRYYRELGAQAFLGLQVTSFTRLAQKLFLQYGKEPGEEADTAVQTVLMSLALDEVKDELTVYQKAAGHLSFARDMLQLVQEFKTASCNPAELSEKVQALPTGRLREKMTDMVRISAVYEALLGERYHDARDDLQKFADLLREHPFFAGRQVFLDGFHGYTGQEFLLLREIFKQCADCTVTLCLDPAADPRGLFAPIFQTRRRLEELAREVHCPVAVPQTLPAGRRFAHPGLAFLETHLMQNPSAAYTGPAGGVHAVLADHELEEVRFTAATVRKLAEEGVPYRDILVVSRDLDTYQSALEEAFRQNDIPFYADRKHTASEHPLVCLLRLALQTAAGSITSDAILSLLKCGLTPYSVEAVAELENYCYTWDIRREDWEHPFVFSPFGLQGAHSPAQAAEEGEVLTRLNNLRAFAYPPMFRLQQALRTRSARRAAAGLLAFLEEFGVRETVNARLSAADFSRGEVVQEASEYRQIWNILLQSAETLCTVLGERPVEPARFAELFTLLSGDIETGTVPQSLDCVQIAGAERVRADAPRVLFVLGVNDQVFPYQPQNDSLFADRDREELLEATGIRLAKTAGDQLLEERFLAYQVTAIPSGELYLLARRADLRGSAKAVSPLFSQVRRLFGDGVLTDVSLLPSLYFCRTATSAFQEMAAHFREDTPEEATLKDYFSDNAAYRHLMEGVLRAAERKNRRLTDPAAIQKLYGRRVSVSPSRIETYHKCQFRYFCEYGLGLKPREKLSLSASVRGSLVHDILSAVCRRITSYETYDEAALRPLVHEAVETFLCAMGGEEHQTRRMLYLCTRAEEEVLQLLKRLFAELGCSGFRPVAFEYEIGKPGNLPPYLFQGEDGITISVHGIVDRVDEYVDAQGKRWVRIIDYKTGVKDFALSDLLNGINLQMFLYLMCLDQQRETNAAPLLAAGALYMPAGVAEETLGRNDGEEDAQLLLMNHFCMKGVILDDAQVIQAMEPGMDGQYTPIKLKAAARKKDGALREDLFEGEHANPRYFTEASFESLLTKPQLQQVFRHLERLLDQMVRELYHGSLEAKPLAGKVNGCDYCEFKTVCGFREGDPVREYRSMKKAAFLETLGKEEPTP